MGEKETGRVKAFSDGVFTIAITLFILGVKVPAIPPGAARAVLLHGLPALWPSYLAFAGSFLSIPGATSSASS